MSPSISFPFWCFLLLPSLLFVQIFYTCIYISYTHRYIIALTHIHTMHFIVLYWWWDWYFFGQTSNLGGLSCVQSLKIHLCNSWWWKKSWSKGKCCLRAYHCVGKIPTFVEATLKEHSAHVYPKWPTDWLQIQNIHALCYSCWHCAIEWVIAKFNFLHLANEL